MAKICTGCGRVLDDREAFCSVCGKRCAADAPPAQGAYGRAALPVQPAAYPHAAAPAMPADSGRAVLPPRNKSKKGLAAVLCCIGVLLAAGAVLFCLFALPNLIVRSEYDHYLKLFDNGDYCGGFEHNYKVMFSDETTLDEAVQDQQKFDKIREEEHLQTTDEPTKILSVADVPKDVEKKLIAQLREKGFRDTDKISDIRAVTTANWVYPYDSKEIAWTVSLATAIKVDGKWYFYHDMLY